MDNNKLDLNNSFYGTVVIYEKEERKLGVYLPRIMSALQTSDKIEYIPMNNNIKIDSNIEDIKELNGTIKKCSFIWTKAKNIKTKLPDIGSTVEISFLDGNINDAYWDEFNSTNNVNYIEDEKYSKLLSINNVDVKEDDNIEFTVDSSDISLEVRKNDKDKKVLVKISHASKYIINPKNINDLDDGTLFYNNGSLCIKDNNIKNILDDKNLYNELNTNDKTIIGAINELFNKIK